MFMVDYEGIKRAQKWVYPGWEQCNICHTKDGGEVLGFSTWQLNMEVVRGLSQTNQLDWLRAHGIFENPEEIQPHALPKFSTFDDPTAPLTHKVRSYLHSNCVQCHQPGGSAFTSWDARISTPLHAANIVNSPAILYRP